MLDTETYAQTSALDARGTANLVRAKQLAPVMLNAGQTSSLPQSESKDFAVFWGACIAKRYTELVAAGKAWRWGGCASS